MYSSLVFVFRPSLSCPRLEVDRLCVCVYTSRVLHVEKKKEKHVLFFYYLRSRFNAIGYDGDCGKVVSRIVSIVGNELS